MSDNPNVMMSGPSDPVRVVEGVIGKLVSKTVSFTRPHDKIGYSGGDVISELFEVSILADTSLLCFEDIFRTEGSSGYLVGAILYFNTGTLTPKIKLHFWDSRVILPLDNDAYAESYNDIDHKMASHELPAMISEGGASYTSYAEDMDLRIPLVALPHSRDLYVCLETSDAFTPTENMEVTLKLIMHVH